MKRVLVLVEGQTEEQFVNQVLREHLWTLDIGLETTRVVTSTVQGRREFRGGVTRYERIRGDIKRLFASKPHAVTTVFDVYGFPIDMPGYPDPMPVTTASRLHALTTAFDRAMSTNVRLMSIPCVVMPLDASSRT